MLAVSSAFAEPRTVLGNGPRSPRRRVFALAASAGFVELVVVAATGAPVAWLMLGVSAVICIAWVVLAYLEDRFFEPMTMIAAVTLISFLLRALELFANATSLQSYFAAPVGVNALIGLDNQLIARFVTINLREPLSPALTRAIAVITIFIVLVSVGYCLPVGRRAAARLSKLGRQLEISNVRSLVASCLALAALGQIAATVRAGGPVQIGQTATHASVYTAGVIYPFLMGFGVAGIIIWAGWNPPRSIRARVGFGLITLELCAFYALSGSRTRVFLTLLGLAIVSHYLWRPWRPRYLAVGCMTIVVLLAGVLAVRQATLTKPLGQALTSAPAYIVHPQALLNDTHGGGFDDIFYATSVIGSPHHYARRRGFQYGMGFVDALRSYIPHSIDPGKPQSGDQVFRYLLFGNTFQAGLPYTVIGDFWDDFGFAGVVVGSLLFGLLARALLGLLGSPRDPGREFRTALYAIAMMLLFIETTVTYSVTIGYFITVGIPFLIAIYGLRPALLLGRRLMGDARIPSRLT